MKLLCYGDSNTYGYDPRGPIPGRYDAADRWCDLLAAGTGWSIFNGGENGRIVPEPSWGYTDLERMLRETSPVDVICIMLGTNDVLISSRRDISPIVNRMEDLLDYLKFRWPKVKPIILAPPPFDIPELPDAAEKLEALIESYRSLAENREIDFINTHECEIPLAYDGAHFSQRGHHVFAAFIEEKLQDLLK